ncbi:hypothetical protein AUEXF2481DRAFT_31439 [Aureobasidium subglaciale EXF-2481]|uniref:Uncharacterized protein n=1 Tax=Aureobasidium subglaciale (strain EXF-2481) TaxID=1043005 RepID=A0A074Z2Y8_AURSE|nr:uncharacterized protein AUEXF2481DRAFT_31439 [Aureobasidium subglaciale EXF-2481]KAI5199711.1 hypothetical protein E4T38_06893 [Aureobasidium subglaciale]KAI5218478.1 hypothetical protein E4T40_06824 [Aureobasidium subglaciale]KAI5222172.1 hypothetical protein E4T41_06744 [Aureobasidium subglaciale]KAI5259693.1 hypothetical protein E4T46_06722 [Aureobasidium subglaciale]KEQ93426.1 hypothetical protein AUEXF2481DRAFT_31439 [Aureobasidium subglaciale EXF-2481]
MAHVPQEHNSMADTMEMVRKLATLEVELRIEREQHALAQQCIAYMARQLGSQRQTYAATRQTERRQPRGRRLERPEREDESECREEDELGARPRIVEEEKRKPEPEDVLTCDDEQSSSLQSPILPGPVTPAPEQTFRSRCLTFLGREGGSNETVDTSNGTEGTLLTFKNSGEVCSEAQLPSTDEEVHHVTVAGMRPAGVRQQPLSLDSLSQRYKDRKPMIDGLYSSQWAGRKDRTEKPDVPQLLVQFSETYDVDEEPIANKAEEAKTPMTEKEKREHAAKLRKNQALVAFDPSPSEDVLRTIVVTNIPKNMSGGEVMGMVSGGIIIKIHMMNTTPITGSRAMMITFLLAEDARRFLKSVRDVKEPKFSILQTPTYPMHTHLYDDVMYNGITRCLDIYGLHRYITKEDLCNAICPEEHKHDGIISASRDEQGVCHLEFTSVEAAFAGRYKLKEELFGLFSRIECGRDPCDRGVPGIEDAEKDTEDAHGDELSGDSEKIDSEMKTEVESETKAGAEPESECEAERDADGWPVGGLNYD